MHLGTKDRNQPNCFLLLIVAITLGIVIGAMPYALATTPGTWEPAAPMETERAAYEQAFLTDGRILIAGGYNPSNGYLSSAEIYDPDIGSFTPTGSMQDARDHFTATVLLNGKVLIAGGKYSLDAGAALATAEIFDPVTGTFTPTGSMATARYRHKAIRLPNGKVLVTGGYNASGYLASAEVYDPATGTFTPTGSMATPRYLHTATMLLSGKILIAGGATTGNYTTSSAELYDPATGTFSATGSLKNARDYHSAIFLPNGKVLIAGGYSNPPGYLASAEIYDPSTGGFTLTGSLNTARDAHTATVLPSGKVLIAGGENGGALASVEIYDPTTGIFTQTNSMLSARYFFAAVLLGNARVLVVGGAYSTTPDVTATAEIYCPEDGGFAHAGATVDSEAFIGQGITSTLLPNGTVLIAGGLDGLQNSQSGKVAMIYDPVTGSISSTGSMTTARTHHTATLLTSGKVLIAGGYDTVSKTAISTAEIYDPSAGIFTPTGSLGTGRYFPTATLLPSGRVLIAGGWNDQVNGALSSAEIYDPSTGIFTYAGSMASSRYHHSALLLPTGKVLITGGESTANNALSTAELYDPATGNFTNTGSTHDARTWHAATILPNNKVLITGGWNSTNGSLTSAEVYDPITGVFNYTGQMSTKRDGHSSTLLPNDMVLIAGGWNGFEASSSTELYDYNTESFSYGGSLQWPRTGQKATLLPNGKVLTVGGWTQNFWWGGTDLYYYTCCGPFIGSMSPDSGSGGASVSITGYNFGENQGGSTITFNGLTAAVSNWSDNEIIAIIPSGATTGSVVVTVDGMPSNGMLFSVTCDISEPALVNPADSVTGVSITPTLSWADIAGVNSYDVQVCNDDKCKSIVQSANVAGSQDNLSSPLNENTTYFWRVRANSSCGSGPWSSMWRFTTICSASNPEIPVLINPVNGTPDVSTTVTLYWGNISGATSYDVQICYDSSCSSVARSHNVTINKWTAYPPLSNSTTYFWRVRTHNSCASGSWSTVSSFVTTETETAWFEDFEAYNAGSFPSPNWSYSGNADIHIDNVSHVSGTQSVRMFGSLNSCWGALLHRPLQVAPPFTVEFYAGNGSENLSGCHPSRAAISLNTGSSWTTPGITLIRFDGDGKIRTFPIGSQFTGRVLGSYSVLKWIKVKISYEKWDASTIRASFWINDEFMGTEFQPACFYSEAQGCYADQANYLTLSAGEGTAWFDNIKITPGAESPPPPPVTPSSAANTGHVTLTLTGNGFTEQTQVSLTGTGLPALTPMQITYISPTTLTIAFDLTGLQPGVYDIRIETPGQSPTTLTDAFEVTGGTVGQLHVSLDAPPAVRALRFYPWSINYGNQGGSDLAASLFVVSNDVNGAMALSPDEPFTKGSLQVLGVNLNGPAGILPPGNSFSIPIFMNVPQFIMGPVPVRVTSVGLKVEKLRADATAIDWASIEDGVKPADIDQDAWDIIWSNFKAQMGDTWAQYLHALNNDATYISLYRRSARGSLVGNDLSVNRDFDTSTYDVRTLLQFEFARAAGALNPRAVLAAAQDIFVPAQGLPLTFGRFASQSIQNRFRPGALGRGWTHTYEYSASVDTDSNITIEGPGDAARSFFVQTGGGYKAMPGDYGTVSLSSGIVTLREKDGMVWQFSSDGRLASITDTNGNSLTLSYTSGNLTTIAYSNGEAITITYSGDRIVQVTDPSGHAIQYSYNDEQLVSVEKPGGVMTSYSYNQADGTPSACALTSITFPDGTHYFYAYDSLGRLSEEYRDGGTEHVTYSYSGQGRVMVTDAQGHNAFIYFGPQGEVLEVQDPLGSVASNAFDAKTQINQLKGPDGKIISLAYDGRGNPVGILNPVNQLVKMSFDANRSRLTELVDSRSNKTQFSYDGSGNLQDITYPDTSAESFGYDSSGDVQSYTNRRHDSIDYVRNARGQITKKSYPDGRVIDYTYNSKGNLITAADSLTGTISMQYDNRDFLTQIDYPGGRGFRFEYNNAGRRTKRESFDGEVINYEYDTAGRLKGLKDGSNNQIVSYQYDGNGRLALDVKGNNTQTTYEYDAAGQLLHMVNYAPDNSVQSRFDYTYDVNGNRTSMTTLAGITNYTYDAIGQLTGVAYPDGHVVTYVYDAARNRVSVTDNSVTTGYTTNNMNQYTQVGNATYSYDTDGNMISKTDTGGTITYEYDAENRLVKVVTPSQGTWEYTYDGLSKRITVKHNGIVTNYVHDPIGLVDVAAEYDGSGTLVARYTHGLGLVNRTAASGSRAYYAFDAIGHTRQMTNSAGTVVNTYDYSPFGEPLQTTETVPNPFRYVGRFGVMEEGNGLSYMRLRSYIPDIGRFTQEDPIIYGFLFQKSSYDYCLNNPVIYIDPYGLKWHPIQWLKNAIDSFFSTYCDIHFPAAGTGHVVFDSLEQNNMPPKSIADTIDNAFDYIRDPMNRYKDPTGIEGPQNQPPVTRPNPCPEGSNQCDPAADGRTPVVDPVDPNEKVATVGVGDQHYVARGDEITYQIYFENQATATAPAQEVIINDTLDSALDWSTFQLMDVAFGDQVITSLNGLQNGADRVSAGDMFVDIVASYTQSSGQVQWTLRTIDPKTGDLPQDALAGFLPPEDGTGRGQGHVTFKVHTRTDRPSGTQITNSAAVTFDTNAAMATNTIFNTITDEAPDAPSGPSPAEGASNVSVSAEFTWVASQYATSYDIYLWKTGETKQPTPTAANLNSPFYDPPGTMDDDTTYNWQVIARNVMGSTEGPVWHFTTGMPDTTLSYYCDKDHDGHINASIDGSCSGAGCQPQGCQTTPGDDCNDNDNTVYLGATEICDNKDNDCNPATLDGSGESWYGTQTTCGVGVCGNTGVLTCSNGAQINTCTPGTPTETHEQSCSDGLDNDCDGIIDGNDSDCQTSNIHLKTGFNLISAPVDVPDAYTFLGLIDSSGTKVDRIMRYDSNTGVVEEAYYEENGNKGGDNFLMVPGEGIIIYVKEDMDIGLSQSSCPAIDLKAGMNWIGIPCQPNSATAFILLQSIGDETVVSSIQRFNTAVGMFETAGYQNGTTTGINFPIQAGDGCYIYMKQGKTGFRP